MLLIVGLGNPGSDHAGQRHNLGFMALDRIQAAHSFTPWRARFHGLFAEGHLGGVKVGLLKPTTYYNESGRAVADAMRFHKLTLDQIVVFHDEIALEPSKVRVKVGGGSAGNNGIKSVDAHIGPDFRRVRIGIGHPGNKDLVHGHVLHTVSKTERVWLDPLLDALAQHAPLLAQGRDDQFMNKVSLAIKPETSPQKS
jgi:PTH1 family peptidyl-tRNA hydrolase